MLSISIRPFILLLIFSSFMHACISDEEVSPEISLNANQHLSRPVLVNPENRNNPYDSIGICHNLYLERYWEIFPDKPSLSEIIDRVSFITSYAHSASISTVSQQNFENILNHPENAFENTLNRSLTSTEAKDSLWSFIHYIDSNQNTDFPALYTAITHYEAYVNDNTSYTPEEKKTILSLTSFIRHGIYLKKRRDDKDWDISIASRTGILQGTAISPHEAVYKALVLGIANQNF